MVSYETIAVKLLSDADVNVSVVAQNFLMVKMARRRFGRKKNYGLTVTVLSPGGERGFCPGGKIFLFPLKNSLDDRGRLARPDRAGEIDGNQPQFF